MIFQSVRQLKDVIKNEEKKLGLLSNIGYYYRRCYYPQRG